MVHLLFSQAIIGTICVDIDVRHVLSAETTDHLVFLELTSIAIYQLGPLIHFMSRFLIKLFLVKVIFLLKLLRKLPDHVIFELEKFALLFVMF